LAVAKPPPFGLWVAEPPPWPMGVIRPPPKAKVKKKKKKKKKNKKKEKEMFWHLGWPNHPHGPWGWLAYFFISFFLKKKSLKIYKLKTTIFLLIFLKHQNRKFFLKKYDSHVSQF
jgi:hypothetical protein